MKETFEREYRNEVRPMPRERDLKLEKYRISGNRYRELKYFCRQYREKQSQMQAIADIATPLLHGDAERWEMLRKELQMIDQAAMEADAEIAGYIIKNVADGIPYEYLGVPCSRSAFFRARKKFFWILDRKKCGIT